MREISIILLSVLLTCSELQAFAQTERRDSINASRIVSDKARVEDPGARLVSVGDFGHRVAVTGAGSIIQYIQTLPGIATGAEGSSAYYVRGGNFSNNLVTLDGVPIYGNSHLLGFASAFPQEVIEDMLFRVGGFEAREGNLTSSHLSLTSKDGNFVKPVFGAAVSNFLLGADASVPVVKNKLSFTASLRMSPIAAEINALRKYAPALNTVDDINALVYDVYGKLCWRFNPRHILSLSAFNTLDSYAYRFGGHSDERIRWSNTIVNLKYRFDINPLLRLESSVSFNGFSNYQGMLKVIGDKDNSLAISSGIKEITAASSFSGSKRNLYYEGGVKLRFARFQPGTSSAYTDKLVSVIEKARGERTQSVLCSIYGQVELKKEDLYRFRLAVRENIFSSKNSIDVATAATYSNPECSILARYNIIRSFGIQATADWTTQYYHTLEGLPLGWSLDMMIASDKQVLPEIAGQYYAGLFFNIPHHTLEFGAYWKKMNNLIWFMDATDVFSSSVAGWRDGMVNGSGTSKGLELSYRLDYDKTDFSLSYSLSKTDRLFPEINSGRPFPATYDRRHMLNLNLDQVFFRDDKREFGFNTYFTYQSGQWASLPSGQFDGHMILEDIVVDYYSSVNNWQFPAYIRWDLGLFYTHGLEKSVQGTLCLGVYNVLNRHNMYGITYDSDSRKWKKISLFPLMPSLSYAIRF